MRSSARGDQVSQYGAQGGAWSNAYRAAAAVETTAFSVSHDTKVGEQYKESRRGDRQGHLE